MLNYFLSIAVLLCGFFTSRAGDTLTVIGVGDMMFGTNFPQAYYLPPAGVNLLNPVKPILRSADVTFGNLEGTFLNKGGELKKCNDTTKCYAFRMPTKYSALLTDAGFDLVSLANNHMGDFGETGRRSTMKVLDSVNVKYAGLLSCPTTTYEKDGVKYGLCAFAPNTGTCDISDIKKAKEIVRSLDSIADIVIVSFHGGAEGDKHQHVTKQTELFYGEDRGNVYQFAHQMIDAGGDIIFGHGPHVTRAIDLYKDRFIIYSMGNFCTYARFNLKGPNGIAPIIKVNVDKKGKFLNGNIIATKQLGEGGPVLDSSNQVVYKIKELTNLDFPESPLIIENSGYFYRK